MANYANLKSDIAGVIRTNNNEEITGDILQEQLLGMVDSLGAGFQYKGVATPATAPGTPDENVFYIATTPGTYTNFGSLVVAEGEVAILKYNGSWTKEVTGAATAAQVTQLEAKVTDLTITKPIDSALDIERNSINFEWVAGTIDNSGQEATSTTRCRSKFFGLQKGTTIKVASGFKFWVFLYDGSLGYVGKTVSQTSDYTYNNDENIVRILVGKTDDSAITANDVANAISIAPLLFFETYKEQVKPTSNDGNSLVVAKSQDASRKDLISVYSGVADIEFEQGSIASTGSPVDAITRLRSKYSNIIVGGGIISIDEGYKFRIYKYNNDGSFNSYIDWITGDYEYQGDPFLVKFVVAKNDDTDIPISDATKITIRPLAFFEKFKSETLPILDPVSGKTSIIVQVDNLANPEEITSGKYLTAAGAEKTDADSFFTDFIPVSVGDKISVLGGFTHITSYAQAHPSYFSTARGTDTPGTQFTIPEGTPQQKPITHIRVSGKIANLPAMVYKGDFSAPYTPYGTPIYIVLARNVEGGSNGFVTVPMLNGLKNTIKRNVPLIENIKDYILDAMDEFLEEVKGEKSDLSIPMMTDIHSGNLEPYEMMAYLAKSGAFDGVFTLGDYIPERFDTKEEAVALLSSVLGAEYSFPYRTRILYALKGNHDNNPTRDVVDITMGSYTDFTPTAGSSTPFSSEGLFKGTIATGGAVYLLGTSTPAVRGTDYDFTIINSDACVYDYDYYNLSELRTKPGNGAANKAYGFLDFDRAKVRVVYLDANDIYVNDVPVVYGGNCLIQNEQMNWFANVALDFTDKKNPTEWGVILLLHSAMRDTESSAFEAILNAFTTGGQVNGTFTRSVVGYSNVITLNKDYSGQGALTFICSVSGHQHIDILRKLSNKYNEVNICCDNQTAGKREGNVTTWYTRTAGTIEEHAIDCLMLDKANRKVYFKRLGVGTDREIEY